MQREKGKGRELKKRANFLPLAQLSFRAFQRPKKYSSHEMLLLLLLRRDVVIAVKRNSGMALTVQMFGVGLVRPEGLLVNEGIRAGKVRDGRRVELTI